MKRIYESIIQEHLEKYNQMIFLTGPRQVGKTTLALKTKEYTDHYLYLNWDEFEHREIILKGTSHVISLINISKSLKTKPILVFDELHKFKDWRTYIKGLYDQYKDKLHIIVTGSTRLNYYRKSGDSLMGRYFSYQIHPLSTRELLGKDKHLNLLENPQEISQDQFTQLFQFGGFPDPFLNKDKRFYNMWQRLRHEQLFKKDMQELSKVNDIAQMEVLASILGKQSGSITHQTTLSKEVRVSQPTIGNWLKILEELYYCFSIRPYTRNVTRSLLKDPKIYLWDWSRVQDIGQRVENFVAAHLLKAVNFWTDTGLGKYNLHYIRDKDKREVDFLITENDRPWMLIEVKTSENAPLSKHLEYFQKQLRPRYTFQLAFDMPYIDYNIMEADSIKIIPMITFFSQLP